jgi:hypothetical protein
LPVASISVLPRKPEYSPLEEVVADVAYEGTPDASSQFTVQVKRDLGNPATDPVLTSADFDFTKTPQFPVVANFRKKSTRRALIQTEENGKYVVRGVLGDYYLYAFDKNTPAVNGGSPTTSEFEMVPVSPYEFRTSYLPERLLYQARLQRTDIDPIELETETQNVLKNSFQDNELERVLKRAESDVLSKLDTALRPTKIITRPDLDDRFKDKYEVGGLNLRALPPGYDEIGPETYYKATDARFYATNHLPKVPVIEVERVRSILHNRPFFEFPRAWQVFNKYGLLNMVPVSGTDIVQFSNAFTAFSPTFSYTARDRVPGFWAVDWTYGHVGDEDEFDTILQMISYTALQEVVVFIGSADKPGISSESRNTGGTSESFSYTQSAIYALFSSDAEYIGKNMAKWMASLRQRIHGPELMVV